MDKGNPTTFKLSFPTVPGTDSIADSKEFFLHLYETIVPEITLEPNENHWKGNRSYGSALGIDYGTWNTIFHIDENFENYSMVYNWMMKIRDGIEQFHGQNATDHQIDSSLNIMDNFNNSIAEFKFINIWPSTLGEISLSYQEGEALLFCTVTFLYDYFVKI